MSLRGKTARKDVDMTTGDISRYLIMFALPLLFGNLFQQLYNMVDTWVVGNYVSNEAFSAVGTVGPIINMLVGFFMGLASGAGVIISQYYGARQYNRVHDVVHTSIVMTLVMVIFTSIMGIFLTPYLLRMMNTPPEVFPESMKYLRIIFSGIAGLMFYNMGSAILRAIGDSKRPFYFLMCAALLNIVLDLLFIIKFHMGVEGVAYATIISMITSAILTIIVLLRTDTCVKLTPKDLKIDKAILKKIIFLGIPAALQMAITSFSNIFVQGYINHFGADTMSGWTAYSKIDMLMFMPMQSLALAVTTFVGQNLGVGDVERAKKGVSISMRLAVTVTIISMIPVIIFAPNMVAFFNSKSEVIYYGTLFLRWITPFYLLSCANQIYSSALRGAGNTKAPMVIMLLSFVVFRQVYLFVMANFIANEILPIAMGYPAGWLLCSLLTYTYYKKSDLSRTSVMN